MPSLWFWLLVSFQEEESLEGWDRTFPLGSGPWADPEGWQELLACLDCVLS